jgi:AcrR family transcriptional regulator
MARRRLKTPPGTARDVRRDLTRLDWVEAARLALIDGGVENVKVERIAKDLGVTRGSFYWHFIDRDDLLGALMTSWVDSNTKPFFDAVARAEATPAARLSAFMRVWLSETDFVPAYDTAMRNWANISEAVAAVVKRVDKKRIRFLQTLFEAIGFQGDDAKVHARITYYHQVGYYALHLAESRAMRLKYAPLYFRALTGLPSPD